jgi:hypothetical protein
MVSNLQEEEEPSIVDFDFDRLERNNGPYEDKDEEEEQRIRLQESSRVKPLRKGNLGGR